MMVTSRDGGKTWESQDLKSQASMILDVKFVNESTGFVCAASDPDVAKSHARILKTVDSGKTWKIVYESARPYEITWKCAFPSSQTGYATVQNYNPDKKITERVVAKTTDGGETWRELPLVSDASVQEFGVGFYNDNLGWVGAMDGIWFTLDGGTHWTHEKAGKAINKIRVIPTPQGPVVYAIGAQVLKLDLRGR